HVRLGLARQRPRVVGDAVAVEAGGVGADLRPEGATEEPEDRLAERLAFEVLPEHGVLERVLPDEARGIHLVDERSVDSRRAVRLTESGEALLREDLDDERLTNGVPAFRRAEYLGLGQLVAEHPGADFADLHGRLRRLPYRMGALPGSCELRDEVGHGPADLVGRILLDEVRAADRDLLLIR